MFVASRVNFEGDGKVIVALPAQVIGNIQTAIGSSTLARANDDAVRVIVGDPVCQGDVIETAADGRIGIRFIDGTVFNVVLQRSRGARANSSATPPALSIQPCFGVTKGVFAFFAGQVARTGSLKIDTPFGSIRGRAHTGGIGMLSLTALTFSLMKEAQAADPNVTFLDDGPDPSSTRTLSTAHSNSSPRRLCRDTSLSRIPEKQLSCVRKDLRSA